MKITVKIFLLLLFAVVAVGAVLVFIKTQVAPPGNVKFHDQYGSPLSATVATVDDKDFPENTSNFRKAHHKVSFMNREGIITDNQSDSLITRIDTVYGSSLLDYAYLMFNSSIWPDEKIDLVSNTIAELRADKLTHGEPAITASIDNEFAGVDRIIADYRAAWEFTGDTAFTNVADASQKINNIETIRRQPFLANNSDLMAALGRMPGAINKAHYVYLEKEIDKLGTYRNYSQEDFNRIIQPQVNAALNEYDAVNIYGPGKIPLGPLEGKIRSYLLDAYEYYDRIEAERLERERMEQENYWDEDLRDLYEQNQRNYSGNGYIL